DVGTGSGYQAAVLAELAGEVHSIERVPELAANARAALADAGYGDRVTVHVGDGTQGLPEQAPFTAVAVAAAAPDVPPALYDQLELRGRLVVPVGSRSDQRLEVVVRTLEGPAVLRSVPCRFVPLVGEDGFAQHPAGKTRCRNGVHGDVAPPAPGADARHPARPADRPAARPRDLARPRLRGALRRRVAAVSPVRRIERRGGRDRGAVGPDAPRRRRVLREARAVVPVAARRRRGRPRVARRHPRRAGRRRDRPRGRRRRPPQLDPGRRRDRPPHPRVGRLSGGYPAPGVEASTLNRAHTVLRTRRHWVQLAKFCVVGAVGYAVNLAVYAPLV